MSAAELNDHSLAIREPETLTAKEIRAQVNLVQEVMKAVMQNGTHYGKIPGCGDKPTLLKPGAEKLASTFRLAINPEIQDLSTKDLVKYRIRALITHQVTGAFLGAGVGECSGAEEKYNWRNSVCDEEYDDTPDDRRRIKYRKAYGKIEKVRQVRTNQADIANTVLKICKKRALVDGILTVTGASDIFTQDIEDMPEELLDKKDGQKPSQDAPGSTNAAPPVSQHPPDDSPPCPKCHNYGMKLIPAGLTKEDKKDKDGKVIRPKGSPYSAFWKCTQPGCKGSVQDSDFRKQPEPQPEPDLDGDPGPEHSVPA